uniref:Protein rhodnius neglectus n=3 Tax=Rhodnius TaxID=13248 RepID=A0A4P6D7K8_RHOPR
MTWTQLIQFSAVCLALAISSVQGNHRDTVLQKLPRETNLINFVRLFVLRLIYGFATMFGFGESISEVGDGALVPPGVDDDYIDDYRDYSY